MGRSGGARRGARVARAPNKGFARRQQEFMGQEVGCMSGGMEV